jgi:hypothetical protein
MKEELISFETAKLANDKGFNWLTKHWYDQIGTLNPTKGVRGAMSYERVAYAPNQSLLQQWLRNTHNIHIEIKITNIGRYYNQVFQFNPDEKSNCLFFTSQNVSHNKFVKYEQALEEALFYALNLITCLKDTITDNTHT